MLTNRLIVVNLSLPGLVYLVEIKRLLVLFVFLFCLTVVCLAQAKSTASPSLIRPSATLQADSVAAGTHSQDLCLSCMLERWSVTSPVTRAACVASNQTVISSNSTDFSLFTTIKNQENHLRAYRLIIFILVGFVLVLSVHLLWRISKALQSKKKYLYLKQKVKELSSEKRKLQTAEQLVMPESSQVLDVLLTEKEAGEDSFFDNLQKQMLEKKLFTDPLLNRKILANLLGTNEKYLRETIMLHLGVTVKTYLTTLRLQHACNLLQQAHDNYTIESIALDSGFGSRATFHSQFKDFYGLTPDEYRKQNL